ncbi:MAG: sigma-70 family RNA polymerase sigma factor [Rhizobacter sp.]
MHDEHSFLLADRDRRRLVRAATRLLGPADAEDVVQDACVRALEAGTDDLEAAPAWLLTVVRHLAIDRLRRRQWLQQWLAEVAAVPPLAAPSAERDAALAQEVTRALRLLARCLAPEDGAALLLHEVFEVGHAEIASRSGRSEAGSRQQLRRALSRLRQPTVPPVHGRRADAEGEEALFRLYLQALQWRDPQSLWAMLRQPPVSASASMPACAQAPSEAPRTAASRIVRVGGQLGLVLTLDGVTLCTVPLGVRCDSDVEVVGR